MYANYDFYVTEYKGSVIPDAPSYDRVALEASAYLDYITSNRITRSNGDGANGSISVMDGVYDVSVVDRGTHTTKVSEAILYKVQLAQCAIAEVCYKQIQDESAKVVATESVGNHSVSYSVTKADYKQREREKYSKAKMYLHGTGLLYRGLK